MNTNKQLNNDFAAFNKKLISAVQLISKGNEAIQNILIESCRLAWIHNDSTFIQMLLSAVEDMTTTKTDKISKWLKVVGGWSISKQGEKISVKHNKEDSGTIHLKNSVVIIKYTRDKEHLAAVKNDKIAWYTLETESEKPVDYSRFSNIEDLEKTAELALAKAFLIGTLTEDDLKVDFEAKLKRIKKYMELETSKTFAIKYFVNNTNSEKAITDKA